MNSKKILILIISFSFFAFICWYASIRLYSSSGNKIIPVRIDQNVFWVEVVSDKIKMQKGLGERKAICENCGMIFEFSAPGKHAFWMKGMNFPLDILWINQGKVVHLEKNIQPDFTGNLMPSQASDKVLEIRAGNIDALNLKVGDMFEF